LLHVFLNFIVHLEVGETNSYNLPTCPLLIAALGLLNIANNKVITVGHIIQVTFVTCYEKTDHFDKLPKMKL